MDRRHHQFQRTGSSPVRHSGERRAPENARALPQRAWVRDITGVLTAQVLLDYIRVWEITENAQLSSGSQTSSVGDGQAMAYCWGFDFVRKQSLLAVAGDKGKDNKFDFAKKNQAWLQANKFGAKTES